LSGERFCVFCSCHESLDGTQFAGLVPSARGKVRDIYDLGDKLLIVAHDRLSPSTLSPHRDSGQGRRVLTPAVAFLGFNLLKDVIPNHGSERH